jgi:hypothetical protein
MRSEYAANEALAAQALKTLPSDTRQALHAGRSEALAALSARERQALARGPHAWHAMREAQRARQRALRGVWSGIAWVAPLALLLLPALVPYLNR